MEIFFKKYLSKILVVTMLIFTSMPIKAASTETVTGTDISVQTEGDAILLDTSSFVVKSDGTVIYGDEIR